MTGKRQRNDKLRSARGRRGWSQKEAAERAQQLAAQLPGHPELSIDDRYFSRWEAGAVPHAHHIALLCQLYDSSPAALGLPGDHLPSLARRAASSPVALPALDVLTASSHLESDSVDRRDFTKGILATLLLGVPTSLVPSTDHDAAHRPIDPLALLRYRTLRGGVQPSDDLCLAPLRHRVARAKRGYQACQYSEVASLLPQLLADSASASDRFSGEDRLAAYGLSAEAHHVAASLLLKHEDHGPAWIAADRSMDAAERSSDPLMIGSSARILVHSFMSTGHCEAATAMASSTAQWFSTTWTTPSASDLSIYGSLLLRGAIAAAQQGQRGTAQELLDEADDSARRMNRDDNLRWTAFGPTNVRLHRVHVAVRLGDAGTALHLAKGIDMAPSLLVERRASLLVDVAAAFAQLGHVEQSYVALRSAEAFAPEELTSRRSVRDLLVKHLLPRSPRHIEHELREFAARVRADR